ncbi:MAG: UvrD-helicase domain-containing protein, partial [Christensenellales bacterium]
MINELMLNTEQLKAVKDTEGAVLVFAGAGSGKTRVLAHRIIHLIEEMNVPDYNVLAITFTNKATAEMKQRLDDMLGQNRVWVSTFHSLCVKILFRYAERLGYNGSFSIFDESASKRLIQKVLREKHIEDDKCKEKFLNHISAAKNAGLAPDAYFNKIRATEKDAMLISEIYER